LKTDFWVTRAKPVFKSPLFWLSLGLPLIAGFVLAMSIFNAESLTIDIFGGKKSIDLFWEYMKVPIALSSLSIPLASWVVANHRSAQLVETIEKQELKRLHDLYYDHSEYFSKTFGRFVDTHYWKYLEREDLYLIHRQLYFQNLEEQKDIFEPNTIVIAEIEIYCRNINKSLDAFIQEFTKNTKEEDILDSLCCSLTIYLQEQLMVLVANLGSRPILPDTNLPILLSAPVEVSSLYQWIVTDYETKGFDAVEMKKANDIARLVMEHIGVSRPEDMKLSAIEAHTTIRQMKAQNAI
jgi:hypothetical protein